MSRFFYRYWWLFYVLLFILIGWLIFSLLWQPYCGEPPEYGDDKIEEGSDKRVDCDSQVKSGGQGTIKITHELGERPGRALIQYDMHNVPDKMEVFYDGKLLVSTRGLTSYQGQLSFYYRAKPNNPKHCTVVISAPEEGTVWEYILHCPR